MDFLTNIFYHRKGTAVFWPLPIHPGDRDAIIFNNVNKYMNKWLCIDVINIATAFSCSIKM